MDIPRIRQENLKLKSKLTRIKSVGLNALSIIVVKYTNDFSNWGKGYKEITDTFYQILTEVYTATSEFQSFMYHDLDETLPILIDDLTYKADGKTLPERVKFYWDETEKLLKQAKDNKSAITNAKIHLLAMLERILTTEINMVSNGVKKNKSPILVNKKKVKAKTKKQLQEMNDDEYAVFVHVDGCACGDGPPCNCPDYDGDYPEDEVPWPPYHSNCDCSTWYYVITNNPDDIHDLDLEVEE